MKQVLRQFRSWLVVGTLAAFTMLILVVANVHQPTMEYGLHCSVHDYIVASLGGECEENTTGLFTDVNSMIATALTLCAVFFVLAFVPLFFKTPQQFFVRAFLSASPPFQLFEFYSRGIAQSRRFA